MRTIRKPLIGLALGGGAARGWSHIGVIRALDQAGIKPDIICGTSIGALVGAVYAAGELDRFEQWVLELKISDVVSYIDVSLSGGLLKGERLMEFFRRDFVDRAIEDLAIPFAAVATSLKTGAEIWLRDGSTLEAVRASIALPGLFEPSLKDGERVEGGLDQPGTSITRTCNGRRFCDRS
jgi:NTE family protein